MVSTTVLRLSISCWMVWLLSASELENDEVFENSESRLSSWPRKICSSALVKAFDIAGLQPPNQGFNPEQQVEVECREVRSTGIWEPGG